MILHGSDSVKYPVVKWPKKLYLIFFRPGDLGRQKYVEDVITRQLPAVVE